MMVRNWQRSTIGRLSDLLASESCVKALILTGPLAAALLTSALLGLLPQGAAAQDTFSIVAVDLTTGQVGGAMATCGFFEPQYPTDLLLDPHPGVGIVVTQAGFSFDNQAYARRLMDRGLLPQAIIDSLVAADPYASRAQYGIASLAAGGVATAYTGPEAFDYKGHLVGPNYAIQGNILQGPHILEGMERAFLGTGGPLAARLMAALQGAKVVGADRRCESLGFSSLSAALVVADPRDAPDSLFLDISYYLHVRWKFGRDANEIILIDRKGDEPDPIDGLQAAYDEWRKRTTAVPYESWGRLKGGTR